MDPLFPTTNTEDGRQDSTLRYAVRTDGEKGFVFVNNYLRMQPLTDKEGVQFRFTTASGRTLTFPRIDVLSGEVFVLPFGLQMQHQTLDWATVQPIMMNQADQPELVVAQIRGIAPQISVDGQTYTLSETEPVRQFKGWSLRLLTEQQSLQAYQFDHKLLLSATPLYQDENQQIWKECFEPSTQQVTLKPLAQHQGLRSVQLGADKVAEQPSEADFEKAAIWQLEGLDPLDNTDLLQINYQGDVARVYADGQLVQDNQWNGNPMLVRVSDLKGKKAELRILPLGRNYPIYLQPEERKRLADAPQGILCKLEQVLVLKHQNYKQ